MRLKTFFRYSDIYRIGGENFIIICEDIDEALFSEKMKKSNGKSFVNFVYCFCWNYIL